MLAVVITVVNVWLWANALAPVTGFQTPDFVQMLGIEVLCALLVAPGARWGTSDKAVEKAAERIIAEVKKVQDAQNGIKPVTPAILY